MKEIKDIIAAYDVAQQQNKRTALATVVHVEGSSYRRPGARMLITEDGKLTGAISGGCLEGDALRKALLVMSQQKPMLVTYDTMDDDDAKFGIGLGCNGIIHILIEPVNEGDANNPIQFLKKISAAQQPAVIVTLFTLKDRAASQSGTSLLQLKDGERYLSSALANTNQSALIIDDVIISFDAKRSEIKFYANGHNAPLTAFIEYLPPAVSLVIVGAGNDAIPLVNMAHALGWTTIVADGRPSYATRERFPNADHIIVTRPEKLLEQIKVYEQTAFVLMTHNYNYDLEVLKRLATLSFAYAGVLGPHKKMNRMYDELADMDIHFTDVQKAAIHGPAGLDIGAETAEEIALSIISEIKMVTSKRNGKELKNKKEAIHAFVSANPNTITLQRTG